MLKTVAVKKSEDVPRRIRVAALDCFIEYGYRGTTIAEIARRVHMSKPRVLYHYPNTEVLLLALLEEWALLGQKTTQDHLNRLLGHSPVEVLLGIQEATAIWMKHHPKMAKFFNVLVLAASEVPPVEKALNAAFETGRQRILSLLLNIPELKKVSKTRMADLALSIHCLIFGSFLYAVSQNDCKIFEKTKKTNEHLIRSSIQNFMV